MDERAEVVAFDELKRDHLQLRFKELSENEALTTEVLLQLLLLSE